MCVYIYTLKMRENVDFPLQSLKYVSSPQIIFPCFPQYMLPHLLKIGYFSHVVYPGYGFPSVYSSQVSL